MSRQALEFDGAGGSGSDESQGRVEVRYSRPPKTADDLIRELVEDQMKRIERITVVTADLEVARHARAMGAVSTGLRDLLRASRVVTLHAPALPATRGMIGAAELTAMPDHAWLINTARSALVDTAALVSELKSGRLSAALDVFDEEPLPADSPLRGLPNVLLTPHAAFMTRECFRRFGESTVEEIRRFLAGEPLRHEVTARMLETMA
jgi:phosphoglycerate dehydrogenase-like enzyme